MSNAKHIVTALAALLLLALAGPVSAGLYRQPLRTLPVPGKVTLLDLGTKSCPPCRIMAPFIKELRLAYEDSAAIIYIDVLDERQYVSRYSVTQVPTLLFFTARGELVHRQVGYMTKERIIKILSELGVPPPQGLKPR